MMENYMLDKDKLVKWLKNQEIVSLNYGDADAFHSVISAINSGEFDVKGEEPSYIIL